jgi:alpha-glucosidase
MSIYWGDGVFSDGSSLFVSNLNPKLNDEVTVKIRVFSDANVEKIMISTLINGEERTFKMEYECTEDFFDYYSVKLKILHHTTQYHFLLVKDGKVWLYNQRGLDRHFSLKQWQFTILAESKLPEWIHDSVFYQIFPDRFYNGDTSNDVYDGEYEKNGFRTKAKQWSDKPSLYRENGNLDFFGGDLDGIVQKLDYLKDLGVTAVYINPIFTALSNHKYDCTDYFSVDKHFGGDEALIRLINAFHDNGMRVVLDISINHVGKHHPWCSERSDFFFFDKNGKMECWNGISDLPVLNYNSSELRDIIYLSDTAVLKKWLMPPYNADGWRFDVGQSTGLMKEHALDFMIWMDIRKELKSVKPDAYLFVEHWDDCVAYLQGDMWDASMNYYGFTRAVRKFLGDADRFSDYKTDNTPFHSDAEILVKEISELHSMIPYAVRMSLLNLVSSHDYPRIGTAASKNAAMVIPLFLFMFPGVPCVYYGDEVSLDGHLEQDCGYRFPMQWNEDKQDSAMLNLYRSLISYRKSSDVLKRGSFKFVYANNDVVGLVRFDKMKCVLLICTVSQNTSGCEIDLKPVGSYVSCEVISQIGSCDWSFGNNVVKASFNDMAGVLFELSNCIIAV